MNILAVHLHLAAGHPVRTEYRPYTLASSGAKQAGKPIDFSFMNLEIKGLACF